jgi:hypothetical protein
MLVNYLQERSKKILIIKTTPRGFSLDVSQSEGCLATETIGIIFYMQLCSDFEELLPVMCVDYSTAHGD